MSDRDDVYDTGKVKRISKRGSVLKARGGCYLTMMSLSRAEGYSAWIGLACDLFHFSSKAKIGQTI